MFRFHNERDSTTYLKLRAPEMSELLMAIHRYRLIGPTPFGSSLTDVITRRLFDGSDVSEPLFQKLNEILAEVGMAPLVFRSERNSTGFDFGWQEGQRRRAEYESLSERDWRGPVRQTAQTLFDLVEQQDKRFDEEAARAEYERRSYERQQREAALRKHLDDAKAASRALNDYWAELVEQALAHGDDVEAEHLREIARHDRGAR